MDAFTAAAIAGNVTDAKAREIIEAYLAADAASPPTASRNITREDLEFENGQLVKIGGMRPQYMDGYRLIDAVKSIAKLVLAAENGAVESIAWEATTPCYVKYISDERYRKFSPEVRRWYKPYRCSSCAALAAQGQEPVAVKCFGVTGSNDPKHPLTLGYSTPLVDWWNDDERRQ